MFIAAISTLFREMFRDADEDVDEELPLDSEANRRRLLLDEQTRFAGRRARAITPLRPVGMIRLDGRRCDAESINAYIEPGEEVEILQASGYLLLVRRVEPNGHQSSS